MRVNQCNDCGARLTVAERRVISDYPMCFACTAIAEMENEHNDGHEYNDECEACRAELVTRKSYFLVTTLPPVVTLFTGRRFASLPIALVNQYR